MLPTGFVRKWENRIPGLFFIFQGLNFFPILYYAVFFPAGIIEVEIEKRRTRFL